MINTSGDLYELAGLDDGRWQILAIDLDAYSHGKDPSWNIYVYAADRTKHEVTQAEDWEKVAAQHNGIPVVKVLLHDVNADDINKCMNRLIIQLRDRATSTACLSSVRPRSTRGVGARRQAPGPPELETRGTHERQLHIRVLHVWTVSRGRRSSLGGGVFLQQALGAGRALE